MYLKTKHCLYIATTIACLGGAQQAFALAAQETEDNGQLHSTNRWPYGCVPYTVSDGAMKYSTYINAAVAEWNSKLVNVDIYLKGSAQTPARCVGVVKTLEFWETLGFCITPSNDSHGAPLTGDVRRIELSPTSCMYRDTEIGKTRAVTHEVGHALGFVHEHQRSDAGLYVRVIPENAVTTIELVAEAKNSRILSDHYDYESIMHYHPTTAGIEINNVRKTTLEFINTDYPPRADIADFLATQTEISPTDEEEANVFYGSNIADMGVYLVRDDACSTARFDKGKCPADMMPHQIKVSYVMINHGPFDSGTTTITHQLPAETTDVDILIDDSGNCSVSGKAVICNIPNIAPVTQSHLQLLVTLPSDEDYTYTSTVNAVAATDDYARNNVDTKPLNAKTGSLGWLTLLATAGYCWLVVTSQTLNRHPGVRATHQL